MPNQKYTHLTLVVDRSGSMEATKEAAEKGIKTLLEGQFAEPDKLTVTIVEFNSKVNSVTRLSKKAIDYALIPDGNTALMDAVGSEIIKTGEDLAKMKEDSRPGKVIFVIVTDGEENSSTDYNIEKVREMIALQKTDYNWSFQFLGAEEADWQGKALGMDSTRYHNTADGTIGLYNAVNASMRAFRSNHSADAKLTMPEEIK